MIRRFARDAGLVWRLLWRGDRRGRTGTLLTVVGVAVAVFCALLVTAVPRALEAADSRLVARTPVGQPGTHGMRITSSIELFEGEGVDADVRGRSGRG